jgi:cytochrome P450
MSCLLFFYLCRNPNVQNRLANEIASAFSNCDDITSGTALQSCEYLTAVLYEGLRMAPPVGADLSRRVLAGGTTVEGRYHPEGTMVSSTAWSLHYDDD